MRLMKVAHSAGSAALITLISGALLRLKALNFMEKYSVISLFLSHYGTEYFYTL
jgi:hypothetical protein